MNKEIPYLALVWSAKAPTVARSERRNDMRPFCDTAASKCVVIPMTMGVEH